MRQADAGDVEVLVQLMAEFYEEADFALDRAHAARAFAQLLADPALGRAWLVEDDGHAVGYAVLTLGFSMEYGGRDAFVDDLFVRAPFRGAGLGTRVLAEVRGACERLGVRALHLEVGRDNEPAQALYRKVGFVETGRQLLTLRLASPSHLE